MSVWGGCYCVCHVLHVACPKRSCIECFSDVKGPDADRTVSVPGTRWWLRVGAHPGHTHQQQQGPQARQCRLCTLCHKVGKLLPLSMIICGFFLFVNYFVVCDNLYFPVYFFRLASVRVPS